MSKRTIAIFLIVLGIVAVVLAVLWIGLPTWRSGKIVAQPPSLSKTAPTTASPSGGVVKTPSTTGSVVNENERTAQERLKQQATDFAARVGTFSSVNGFDSLREASLLVNGEARTSLMKTRQDMIVTHPMYGPSWGQTTKSVAVRITSGFPIQSNNNAELVIQVQRTTETGNIISHPFYEEVTLSYVPDHSLWIVTRVASKPFAP